MIREPKLCKGLMGQGKHLHHHKLGSLAAPASLAPGFFQFFSAWRSWRVRYVMAGWKTSSGKLNPTNLPWNTKTWWLEITIWIFFQIWLFWGKKPWSWRAKDPEKWCLGDDPASFWGQVTFHGRTVKLQVGIYCWGKFFTTWLVWNPVNNWIFTISAGWQDLFHQQYVTFNGG